MTSTTNTIPALKTAFLKSQARLLSQPLQPEKIIKKNAKSGDGIPESVIQDVTREVNRRIKRYSKAAYSSLAIRAVSEQIDNLYWQETAVNLDDGDGRADESDKPLTVDDDLSRDANISRLPALIESFADGDEEALSATNESLSKLQSLSEQRQALQQKLAKYEALITLLEPFLKPQETVQPNLVTRDGALAAELAKLRTLTLRVNGRLGPWIANHPEQALDMGDMELDVDDEDDEQAKLARLLGG